CALGKLCKRVDRLGNGADQTGPPQIAARPGAELKHVDRRRRGHVRTSPKGKSSIASSNAAPARAACGAGFSFSALTLARPIWDRWQCQLRIDKPVRVTPSLVVHSFSDSRPST